MKLTLPVDSAERKNYPMVDGPLSYFPAALAGVALVCKLGNDKHNPGQPLHHARGKSGDHANCIVRHLMDVNDIRAYIDRGGDDCAIVHLLHEVNQAAWRMLALAQELHEEYGDAPLAPGARLPEPVAVPPPEPVAVPPPEPVVYGIGNSDRAPTLLPDFAPGARLPSIHESMQLADGMGNSVHAPAGCAAPPLDHLTWPPVGKVTGPYPCVWRRSACNWAYETDVAVRDGFATEAAARAAYWDVYGAGPV